MFKKQILPTLLKIFKRKSIQLKKLAVLFMQLPKKHRIIILIISGFLLLLMLLPSEQELTTQSTDSEGFQLGKRYQIAMPQHDSNTTNTTTIDIPSLKDEGIIGDTNDAVITVNSQQQSNMAWQTV